MKEVFDNEMKLEFISKSSNEAFARIAVAAFASQLDPTIEELADIKTAVSSGMGFTIMESFMDKMKVESILGLGTKVTMSKIIKPKIESEEEQFEALLEN